MQIKDDNISESNPNPAQIHPFDGAKTYVGTKIVMAREMDEVTFLKRKNPDLDDNRETRLGYLVCYEDGYTSWSPKEVFERCYRELTKQEKDMAISTTKK